jgi:hypothetical protein
MACSPADYACRVGMFVIDALVRGTTKIGAILGITAVIGNGLGAPASRLIPGTTAGECAAWGAFIGLITGLLFVALIPGDWEIV